MTCLNIHSIFKAALFFTVISNSAYCMYDESSVQMPTEAVITQKLHRYHVECLIKHTSIIKRLADKKLTIHEILIVRKGILFTIEMILKEKDRLENLSDIEAGLDAALFDLMGDTIVPYYEYYCLLKNGW
jgi:hypothetical protein